MIFSDGTIRRMLAEGRLRIEPLEPEQIQPSTVDVRLGAHFRVFRNNHVTEVVDPYDAPTDLTELVEVGDGQAFVLHPGEFVLATTVEWVALPADVIASVDGKSSLGRWGILIHATAGIVDGGFEGQITLELSNVSPLPVKLWPGMRIGQLTFMAMDRPAERPYGHPDLGSKYQGQRGPVASRYSGNARPPST